MTAGLMAAGPLPPLLAEPSAKATPRKKDGASSGSTGTAKAKTSGKAKSRGKAPASTDVTPQVAENQPVAGPPLPRPSAENLADTAATPTPAPAGETKPPRTYRAATTADLPTQETVRADGTAVPDQPLAAAPATERKLRAASTNDYPAQETVRADGSTGPVHAASTEPAPADAKQRMADPSEYPAQETVRADGSEGPSHMAEAPAPPPRPPVPAPPKPRMEVNDDGSLSSTSTSTATDKDTGATTTTTTTRKVPGGVGSPGSPRNMATGPHGLGGEEETVTTTTTKGDLHKDLPPPSPAPATDPASHIPPETLPLARRPDYEEPPPRGDTLHPDPLYRMTEALALKNRTPVLRVELFPMPGLPADTYYSAGIRVLFRDAPALQITTDPARNRYAPALVHVSRFLTSERGVVLGWSSSGPGRCTLHALAVRLVRNGKAIEPTDYLRAEFAQPCGGLMLSEKPGLCLLGVEVPTETAYLEPSRYFLDSMGTLLSYAELPLTDTSFCQPEDGAFTRLDNLAGVRTGVQRNGKVIWLDFSTGKFRTIDSASVAMTPPQARAAMARAEKESHRPAAAPANGRLTLRYGNGKDGAGTTTITSRSSGEAALADAETNAAETRRQQSLSRLRPLNPDGGTQDGSGADDQGGARTISPEGMRRKAPQPAGQSAPPEENYRFNRGAGGVP
ncbi:hypothetical protein DB346_10530 [Verrucomicrobia bacterium LW23]|nr:hypothetical protein DB346_10530 [Verrucomicrobia bacterium LW23]